MHKSVSRHFDWKGHIETLEDRRVMSADPLLGGSIEHHYFVEEEAPLLDHHLVSEPDFWLDTENLSSLEDQLNEIEQTLYSAHNTTGLNSVVTNYGFTGIGQTVAVIDSGIAYDHFALGGGFGANYRVVGGWDFSGENDANPYDDGPEGSHGTHVAGIVGGSAGNDKGVAPGVDLVALRVFDDAGAGYFSWVESALQWVHANRNSFENPITAINLSLGVASWNSNTIPAWATLENEFAQLEADGIFIAVSAGNSYTSYNTPGLSYPAASPYVVPVMSVTDGGVLASYSQRDTRAIAAPGSSIRSTVPDYAGNNNGVTDDYAVFSGTSMASPYIAGSSVLIRQAMQFVGYTNITQDMIHNHMMSTGTAFVDASTGLTFKRLNLSAAINALMPTDDYGSTVATAHNFGSLSSAQSVSGVISTLTDADYFKFTASATGTVSFAVSDTTHNMDAAWSLSSGSGTLSNNGDTFAFSVVAGQTYTVGLTSTGGLGHYDLDVTLAQTSQPVMTVKTMVRSDGAVFSLDSENWLRVNGSRVWQNTGDFTLAADGTLYWHCTNGFLQHRLANGSWVDVISDSTKFAVGTDGTVYSLGSDNWLSVNGYKVWSQTADFALGGDQTLYWQSTTGYLQHRLQNGVWQNLDNNVTRFAVRQDGRVYSHHTDNWMKVDGYGVWQATQDFVFTADQSLYWQCTNGVLQHLPSQSSWMTLGNNVAEFAVRHDGAVYCLTGDGRILVDGVQQWSNVADISSDRVGSLVIEYANGTEVTMPGRFKLGGEATIQTSSVSANSVPAAVGDGIATNQASVTLGAWAFGMPNDDVDHIDRRAVGLDRFNDQVGFRHLSVNDTPSLLRQSPGTSFSERASADDAFRALGLLDSDSDPLLDSSAFAFVAATDHWSISEHESLINNAVDGLFDQIGH